MCSARACTWVCSNVLNRGAGVTSSESARPVLTDIEVRILGALAEKEATTPDAYPLSLNALVNASNQTSNRDPVMALTEDQVRWAVNNLRQHSLVRAVQRSDARVMKYQHLLDEALDLSGGALAVM